MSSIPIAKQMEAGLSEQLRDKDNICDRDSWSHHCTNRLIVLQILCINETTKCASAMRRWHLQEANLGGATVRSVLGDRVHVREPDEEGRGRRNDGIVILLWSSGAIHVIQ